MEFNIKNILNIEDNTSANNIISKYLDRVEENVIVLVNEITNYNNSKKYFILPEANHIIAKNIKRLIICGYLIMYDLTNSPVALVQADLILKNEKLSTPDVLFFLISIMDDFLKKKNNFSFVDKISNIQNEIKKISSLNPEYFDVNLNDYRQLKIDNSKLEMIEKNDYK